MADHEATPVPTRSEEPELDADHGGRGGPDAGDASGGQGGEYVVDPEGAQPTDGDPDPGAGFRAAHAGESGGA